VGELAVLASFPSVVVVFFAAVTQLADPWFVFGLLGLLYVWPVLGLQRRDSARLFGLSLVAAAAVLALKVGIGLPRPPGSSVATIPRWLPWPLSEAFHRVAATDGFGFPSGHATGATVLYGGLAALLEWRRRRDRVVIAGVLIAAVMLSRLVLGVHFLIDVIAGGILGGFILWLGLRRGDPEGLFGVAALVALLGAVIAAWQGHVADVHDAVMSVGSAVGGAAGWHLMRRTRRTEGTVVRPRTGALVVIGGAGAWTAAYALGASSLGESAWADALALLGAASLAAVAIGLVVGLPALLVRWERRKEKGAVEP
jgi:membrane-associated phospholipid phosphatase